MGITQRREREREEVRRKILDAAQDLFATEGYERVTMRRVAEAIEYSPTTIYLHFKDKDELVHSLCDENFRTLIEALGKAEPTPADPVEKIRQLGLGYARFGVTHPNHYRFMFLTPFGDHHQASAAGEQAFGIVRAMVAEAIASGRFRSGDVDTTAQVLWASLHGVVSLLITYGAEKFPCSPAAPDLVDQLIDNGLRGFLVDPEPVARRSRAQKPAPRKRGR
jgi:AcrR family transcriptional regulator